MDLLSSLLDKTISLLFLFIIVTNGPIKLYGQVNALDLIFDNFDPKNCYYSKRNSMYQVTCNNLGMRKIPNNLKTDIEVITRSKINIIISVILSINNIKK